jgi:hypothetical protein
MVCLHWNLRKSPLRTIDKITIKNSSPALQFGEGQNFFNFFSLFLFIKNSNLVYTNKPFVSNLICYCEFTKYLFYNNHFGSDNISALP